MPRWIIPRFLRRLMRGEHGQTIVWAAFSMIAMLGFTALATDGGLYIRDLRDAQNDADAAALAGAEILMIKPASEAVAIETAEDWAAHNGAEGQVVWSGDGSCGRDANDNSIPWGVSDANGDGDPDTVCLAIERSVPAAFARVLGITSFPTARRAAARVVHAGRGAVCPWALKSDDPSDTDPGDGTFMGVEIGKIYTVKVGAGESGWGNFGILRLYGPGKDDYKTAVAAGCANNGYNAFSENDIIMTETETGNVGNPSMQMLEAYFGYELYDGVNDGQGFDWCDVPMNWDAVTEIGTPSGYDPNVDGARQGCGTDALNGRSGRYMLIPIVDDFPPPGTSQPVEILAIANVYVTGWGEWDPATGTYKNAPGGHANIYVEFVEEAPFKPKDLVGVSDNPLAPLRVMLIR
jgi:hypothetical protein